MGNQQGKERRNYGRKIDWENAEKPSPPGKPYLIPDLGEQESDFITIRWAPPVSDGGAPILGYIVEHRRTGSPHWLRAIPYLAVETKLTLTGLEPGWRYQFRVSAENDIGRSPPGEISEVLTVTSQRTAATSPHFNVELRDTIALENEKVEFVVHVVAIPQAKISWYKDGFEVFSSRRMKIVTENDQSTFIIHQAALEDEGEIKCTATNRAGHSVTKAILKLEAPPRIRLPRQYEDGLLFERGELIRLKVTTAGRPPPLIAWYHNGELIENNKRYEVQDAERMSSLRITEAERADRGEYLVKGVNKIGEDIASFLVTVTDRPMPPSKPKVSTVLGRSVTLSWESPQDDGGCKIGSYTVEYFRVGWNMWLKAETCRQLSTTLTELIEGSEYKFRIKAENPYGMSDPSEESDVVFIPDPKRGILSPPLESGKVDLWLEDTKNEPEKVEDTEKRRKLEESAKKLLDVTLPAVLSQEKPIENHSEERKREREGSEDVPPPVPKRRHRTERQRNTPSPCPPETQPLPEARQLRVEEQAMFHGSSELMLVLLPEEESRGDELSAQQRSEIEMNLIGAGIAPPMSLSAPELGSGEPLIMPPMRDAVSSTELLHELAMNRLYQDALDEESQRVVRRRYSSDRRSAERRSSLKDGSLLERRHSFKDGMLSAEEERVVPVERSRTPEEGRKLKRMERMSSVEREQMEFAIVRERLRLKNEQNLQEKDNRGGEAEDEEEYEEEEEEEEDYLDEEEEMDTSFEGDQPPPPVPQHGTFRAPHAEVEEEDVTYHPVTSRITLPRLEITLPPTVEEPEPEPEPEPESKQVAEPPREEPPAKKEVEPQEPVKKGKKRTANLLTKLGLKKEKKVPEIVVEADSSGTPVPKPILKNKAFGKKGKKADKAKDESRQIGEDSEEGTFAKKKKQVRIAEPSEDIVGRKEPLNEDQQATQVLICHYSDIVREFGQGKKPSTKQYLNCEEMKAAADEEKPPQGQLSRTPTAESLVVEDVPEVEMIVEEVPEPEPAVMAPEPETESTPPPSISPSPPSNFRSSFDYLTDVAMFLFACWLYVFSNELYAVPVLCVMAYRQVSEAAREKYASLKAAIFGRRKGTG